MPNTREKLIELLECTYGQVEDRDYDCYGECRTCQAENLIANGVGFLPKWIPVSERLPKEEDVIVGGFVLAYTAEERIIIALWNDVCRFTEFVTHWMPLPEPPKGE